MKDLKEAGDTSSFQGRNSAYLYFAIPSVCFLAIGEFLNRIYAYCLCSNDDEKSDWCVRVFKTCSVVFTLTLMMNRKASTATIAAKSPIQDHAHPISSCYVECTLNNV